MELISFCLAIYFAFGYAIERENRKKAEEKINSFYGNKKQKKNFLSGSKLFSK